MSVAVTFILLWAFMFPHEVGKWLERVKDPYRSKPIHQKGKRK